MDIMLGDLVSFASGNTPSKSNPKYWGGETPWISANAMHTPFINESELRITNIAVEEKAKLCAEGDILLLVRGSGLHSRLPIGIAEIPVAFNQDVKAIRSVDNRLDQQYLFYWFRGNQDFLLESVEYTGIGAGKLDTDFLKKLTISLPCLNEQHAIAQIGRCFDRKIELNQKMNQTLEEIAKAIFKSWFVDFDPVRAKVEGRPTGLPPEISELFPNELVDSEIGEIPKGWCISTFADVMEIQGGFAFKSKDFGKDGDPVIKIKNIRGDGTVDQFDCDRVTNVDAKLDRFLLKDGDAVIAMTGATVGKVGLMSVVDDKFYLNQRVGRLVSKSSSASCWYSVLLLGSEKTKDFIEGYAYGSAQPNISSKDIGSIPNVTPSYELLESFNEMVSPLFQRVLIILKENVLLSEIRDTILPKLISGELRISDADKLLEETGI